MDTKDLAHLTEHLRALETELLSTTTRKNTTRVAELLAENFQEFGSSGRIYTKAEILQTLQQEPPTPISLSNFAVTPLSPTVTLATYQSHKTLPTGTITALRSSLWIQTGNVWQIIFHQGTALP